jgi:hypothetical protein
MPSWEERTERAVERYEDGAARIPDDPDERQRQLTRMGNTAWAAGLSLLMSGREDEGRAWLLRAADRYRESWASAPPASWGRPIGALKARLVAGDLDGAIEDATWALDAGAAGSDSPIGRYAGALALEVLSRDDEARDVAASLRDDDGFPEQVAAALVALATREAVAYDGAVRALLADFEAREEFLEDMPVADTVLALQALAATRDMDVRLTSPLLPSPMLPSP